MEDVPQQERNETPAERYDRNWSELLQEVRVAQTGNQILFGFLLVLPFQPRFESLDDFARAMYLVVFCLVTLSTIGVLAPVTAHRLLFRRHLKQGLVSISDQLVKGSLLMLGLALASATVLVVDLVLGRTFGIVLGAAVLLIISGLWVTVPLLAVGRSRAPAAPRPPDG